MEKGKKKLKKTPGGILLRSKELFHRKRCAVRKTDIREADIGGPFSSFLLHLLFVRAAEFQQRYPSLLADGR